ncbi:MAG: hypothetical protein FJZ47_07015 [Candidatus Tectomicrobia bacterium]|uniref:Transmembrane protein n=1 Tax=Tectimicrobiota bacterium TaxID=2528274 RepID=A0A937VYK2_UNCTE|nr:hypothetical protein [Candidatus Tectomicrobia bacterium]
MGQDTTSALAELARFTTWEALLAARSHEGCAEGKMTFEAFAVALGQAVRGLENELKAADLARYDVAANAVMVGGQEWRKCLEQQRKTYLKKGDRFIFWLVGVGVICSCLPALFLPNKV